MIHELNVIKIFDVFVMFMFLELITRVIIGNLSEGILYAFKKVYSTLIQILQH